VEEKREKAQATLFNCVQPRDPAVRRQQMGRAIFHTALPFSIFDNPEMKAFVNMLDPSFQIPSRTTISTDILDNVYFAVKSKVDKELEAAQFLNLTTDESADTLNRRIMNLSVVTENRKAYYCCSHDVGSQSMTVTAISNWVYEQVSLLALPEFPIPVTNVQRPRS
jgi:hypothetical protein